MQRKRKKKKGGGIIKAETVNYLFLISWGDRAGGGWKTSGICTFPARRRGSRLRNLLVISAGVGLNGSERDGE